MYCRIQRLVLEYTQAINDKERDSLIFLNRKLLEFTSNDENQIGHITARLMLESTGKYTFAEKIPYLNTAPTPKNFIIDKPNKYAIESTVSIFPNPASNYLNIEMDGNYTNEIIIFNILGKEIMKVNLQSNKSLIDISDLPQGLYLIKFLNNTNVFTLNIIR